MATVAPLRLLSAESAHLDYYPTYLTALRSADLLAAVEGLPLEHYPTITLYGRTVAMRRDVGFFSDSSEGYRYSGQISRSVPLTPELSELMAEVNATLDTDFNGILINRYADGSDYISPHSDDEKSLSRANPCVAAISLGASRIFRIRNKQGSREVDVSPASGSLLVMAGAAFQQ